MRKAFLVVALFSLPVLGQTADSNQSQRERLWKLMQTAQSTSTKTTSGSVQVSGTSAEPIVAFSLSATAPATMGGTGLGAGKLTYSEALLVKMPSALSSTLLFDMAAGRVIPTVIVDLTDDKGTPIAHWKFSDVLVTSYQISNGSGPYLEGFGLTFTRIEFTIP